MWGQRSAGSHAEGAGERRTEGRTVPWGTAGRGEEMPKAVPPECCAFYLAALPCPHLDFSTSSSGSGLGEPGPASPTSQGPPQARPPKDGIAGCGHSACKDGRTRADKLHPPLSQLPG